tara:strand:- start:57 stop:3845 length:3789 start_codon:yes stop_codon:yes gene_type:complete
MSEYTDTILLEANRRSSAEFLGGNLKKKNIWTNVLGSGVKLDIGDTISLHSAYISEIGNESSTIEIKGRMATDNRGQTPSYELKNVTKSKIYGGKTNGSATSGNPVFEQIDGNVTWEFKNDPVTKNVRDDTINLTHSYYKNNQGDYYISLPRHCSSADSSSYYNSAEPWKKYNSLVNGSCYQANPYRLGSDYSSLNYNGDQQGEGYGYPLDEQVYGSRTELINDGSRYTLFVRDKIQNFIPKGQATGFGLQGERDPALMNFIWYRKTIEYKITQGFNSPANVGDQFTSIMADAINTKKYSYSDDDTTVIPKGQTSVNNFNLTSESNTYELFPCATAWMINSQSNAWFNNNLDSVSVKLRGWRYPNSSVGGLPGVSADITTRKQQNVWWLNEKDKDYFKDGILYPGMRLIKITNDAGTIIPEFNGIIGSRLTFTTFAAEYTQIALTVEYRDAEDTHPTVNFHFSAVELSPYYESCFSTIGYKRPEIQEYGRELTPFLNASGEENDRGVNGTKDGSFLSGGIQYPMTTLSVDVLIPLFTFPTGIPWTADNLTNFKNFFESQEKYPELFSYNSMSASQQTLINTTNASGVDDEGINVSIDKMRFLHCNVTEDEDEFPFKQLTSFVSDVVYGGYIILNNTEGVKKGMIIHKNSDGTMLFPNNTYVTKIVGTKIYVSNAPLDPTGTTGNISFSNFVIGNDFYYDAGGETAGGLFFDYNSKRKDIIEGEGNGIITYDSLTYGYAKKYKDSDGNEFIGLSMEKYQYGTLPVTWFQDNSLSVRCVGFDKHFNAYGTSAILLSNGNAGLWGGEYDPSFLKINATDNNKTDMLPVPTEASQFDGRTYSKDITGHLIKSWQPQPATDGAFIMNRGVPNPITDPPLSIPPDGDYGDAKTFGPSSPMSPYWAILDNEIYCGANQPSLQFDSESSRFNFFFLHTPELVGNNSENVRSGSGVPDSTAPVIKLNKRMSRLTYSPNFIPYNHVFKILDPVKEVYSETNTTLPTAQLDKNMVPFSIMDARCGITLEDYGVPEKYWDQSLWNLLGFSYDQFHQNSENRQSRFNNKKILTSTPTTNGLLEIEDLDNFITRGKLNLPIGNTLEVVNPKWNILLPLGIANASTNPPTTSQAPKMNYGNQNCPGFADYPPIAQNCSSTSITAENLPRKMLSPVYLIKTDLLNPTFIGGRDGRSVLPVIGIVDKENGYGDYFFGGSNSTVFVNTIPRTIQNIRTSICEPDGTESRVDDGCLVIYKITKAIKSNAMVLENMINPPPK